MSEREQWKWYKEDKQVDNEVDCHTLIAGNVLCRYWGDTPKSKEAKFIESAKTIFELLKELREWHKNKYQNNRYINFRVDSLIKKLEK